MKQKHTDTWLEKIRRLQFLTFSFLIHLCLGVLLGGVVLFKAAQKEHVFVSQEGDFLQEKQAEEGVEEATPPEEFMEPTAASPSESAAHMESASLTASLSTNSPTMLVSNPTFQTSGSTLSALPHLSASKAIGSERTTSALAGRSTFFGRTGTDKEKPPGLEGILYDLKQTPGKRPSKVTPENYPDEVREFLDNGWAFKGRGFYTASEKMYASKFQIAISDEMVTKLGLANSADAAPAAFGVEKEVEPKCWIIHYKGKVEAKKSGYYRFRGVADDYVVVAADKTIIHYFGRDVNICDWKSKEADGAGDWIKLQKGQIVQMDILIGERPGTYFMSDLTLEYKSRENESVEQSGFATSAEPKAGNLIILN